MKNILFILSLFALVVNAHAQKSDEKRLTIDRPLNQFLATIEGKSDFQRNNEILEYAASLHESLYTSSEYLGLMNKLNSLLHERESNYLDGLYTLGKIFQDHHDYQNAYPYFYRISLELNNERYKFSYICGFYEFLGHNYYYFKRNSEAEVVLNKGLQCDGTTPKARININNTLGLIYRTKKEYGTSENYFRTALKIAENEHDDGWSGVLIGNLGEVSFMLNKYKEAENFLVIDYEQGLKNNQVASSINALSLLVRVAIKLNDLGLASRRFAILDSLYNSNKTVELRGSYLLAKIDLLKNTNNYKGAFEAFDALRFVQDTLNQRRDLVNIKNTEFQIEFERKQSEIRLLQESKKLDADRINAMWFALTSLLIGATITIWQISKRRKREKELLKLKNEQMGLELKMSERELRNVLRNLMEKNSLIAEMNEELEDAQKQNSKSNTEQDALTKTLQSFTLLTEEDWLEFKRLFEKCYRGFFEYFNTNFEDITNAEIRLAALIKLDLENLEMSNALGISPDSVRKTNLRLRKRVGITEQKELQKFIQSI